MSNEPKKKQSNYFDTKKQPDIEPQLRDIVFKYAHQRRSEHLLNWYLSRKQKMKNFTPEQYNKMEELLKDPKKSLLENSTLDLKTWVEYLDILEESKSLLDETSYIKEKTSYEEIIEDLQSRLNTFSWDTLFKFHKYLFSDGAINIMLGGMGSGKSTLALMLALSSMQSGNYELITNLGIKKEYLDNYNDIHYVTSFKELLLIVCKNQLKNIEYESKGKHHKVKNIIAIIDEGEQLMDSEDKKEVKQFNLLSQFFRKLSVSMTLIYHSWEDVPKKLRRSASLNCRIFKNLDKEGNPINMGKDNAMLEFPMLNKTIMIQGLTECKMLISKFQSVFIMEDFDNFPELSVNIKQLLRLGLDPKADFKNMPQRIINEIEKERVQYFSEERLIKEIKKIEMLSRDYKIFCEKKTEYFQFVKSNFEKEFRLANTDEVKDLTAKIRGIVYNYWVLDSIDTKVKEKNKELDFNYKKSNREELYTWLEKSKLKEIKQRVNIDYRTFNLGEHTFLTEKGISSNKLKNLYGQIKEILQKTKKKI